MRTQPLAARICCTFSPTTFSSVQSAHGHWCAFTDLYHTSTTIRPKRTDAPSQTSTIPYHTIPDHLRHWCAFTDLYHTIPSTIPDIRSWTRTLRRPGIRHRHLPYHTIPYQMHVLCSVQQRCTFRPTTFSSVQFSSAIPYHTSHSIRQRGRRHVATLHGCACKTTRPAQCLLLLRAPKRTVRALTPGMVWYGVSNGMWLVLPRLA